MWIRTTEAESKIPVQCVVEVAVCTSGLGVWPAHCLVLKLVCVCVHACVRVCVHVCFRCEV